MILEKNPKPGEKEIEPQHKSVIRPDYLFPNFDRQTQIHKIIAEIDETTEKIKRKLGVLDEISTLDVQKSISEMVEKTLEFWRQFSSLIESLEKHPFTPSFYRKERQPNFNGKILKEAATLEKKAGSLILEIEALKKIELEKIALESESQKIAADLAEIERDLKETAQTDKQKSEKFLALGFFPNTRRQNHARFEDAKTILEYFNSLASGQPYKNLHGRLFDEKILAKIKKFEELLKRENETKKRLTAIAYTVDEATKRVNTKTYDYQQNVGSFLKTLHGLDSYQKDGEGLREIITRAERAEITTLEQEKEIEELFFKPFNITENDERRALSEPLSEGASEAFKEARERSFKNLRESIRRFTAYYHQQGRSSKEISEKLQPLVERAKRSAFISFNERSDEISEILDSGKILPGDLLPEELRSRSSTERSAWKHRRKVEDELGFKKNEHPVYLALGTSVDKERGAAPEFGAFHFVFSLEALKNKAVCTIGDSLNESGLPFSLRDDQKGWLGAANRQLTLEHGIIAKAIFELDSQFEPKGSESMGFFESLSYIEVQTPGPLSVADSEELVLSQRSALSEEDCLSSMFPDSATMIKKISRLTRRFRISDDLPEGTNNQRAYERFFKKTKTAA
ncbi:MAG: hypothetical protein UX09_C0055G0012 [Candidatus Uhrbacteria bacterium GW2011_GWE2_45_35]|uniref:Uncharacterized protein n=2 Tax=Candidatus Uhriibacteriota TaxID=1752732 RepID=A0A0G1MAT0_9BACT|nr:MAG: hypothetical protein UW63_C0064G0012 [Candidatus Uhrbacteria bacterium GW2011_GWF2_44_350]KKU06268.1 MAG: hypothetical protein UX09_C0055G0012 [Candidatus Uhrbacteria bacterium GW2011_GWE2_45_35]HBR80444.1 hypothetical protein [Candidatus Uhrbacteria bacterium]HCU31433.1 hypothetical protein [Candidatus Uhrbacteria bacterium]